MRLAIKLQAFIKILRNLSLLSFILEDRIAKRHIGNTIILLLLYSNLFGMLRIAAHILSVVFHPLLILTYMLVLLLLINPYLFGLHHLQGNIPLILLVFSSTFLIPACGVLLMKQLGFIHSLQMKDRMERIGPYIMTGIFYMWMFRNMVSNPTIPTAYSIFVLGSTIALFLAFFINIFTKISAHAIGMGGLLGMVILTMWNFSYGDFPVNLGQIGTVQVQMHTLLMVVILLAGMVGTARLILKAHEPKDLYGGYLIGFVTQFLAFVLLV